MEATATKTPPVSTNGQPATSTGGRRDFDAIVVGGGHNGLTTAAYLARGGLDVCVLERRHILGGACVTEEVWPGARVSRASYVVSMLQPKVVGDLRLHDYGYRAVPLNPAYAALTGDGPIFFFDETTAPPSPSRASPHADAAAYPEFEELLMRAADFLRPMMLREPPALGSKRPGDLASLLRDAGATAGLGRRELHELVRDLHDVRRRSPRRLLRARRGQGIPGVDGRRRRLGGAPDPGHRVQPPPPRARRARRSRPAPGDR